MKTNKNTPNKGFKLDIKSFYEDWDNDGVINGVDCYPKDKSRQDAYTDFKNMAKTAGNVAVNLSKPYIRLATNPVAAVNQAGVGLNRLVTNPGKFSQTVVSNLTRSPTKTIISRPAPLRQAYTVTKRFQSSLPSKTSWKPSITSRVSPGLSSNKIIRKTMPQSMKTDKIVHNWKKIIPVPVGNNAIRGIPLRQAFNNYGITSTGRGQYTAIKTRPNTMTKVSNFTKAEISKLKKRPLNAKSGNIGPVQQRMRSVNVKPKPITIDDTTLKALKPAYVNRNGYITDAGDTNLPVGGKSYPDGRVYVPYGHKDLKPIDANDPIRTKNSQATYRYKNMYTDMDGKILD